MTNKEKGQEIGDRTIRLSVIRGELAVSRKKRDDALANLRLAGQNVDQYNNNPPHDEQWLSPTEIRDLIFNVTKLEKEAREIISELRELGADENLFRLNGD